MAILAGSAAASLSTLPSQAATCTANTDVTSTCENLSLDGNLGTITISAPVVGSGFSSSRAAIGVPAPTTVSNLIISNTGAASVPMNRNTDANTTGIFVGGSIGRLQNFGTVNSVTSYGIYIFQGRVDTLENNGIISTQANGFAFWNNGGTIGTLNNFGTITGGLIGIENKGTITTLNNAQTGLTYGGTLPQNYNIIIQSPTQYGTLTGIGVSGATTFGIYPSSILSASNQTYSGVITGLSSSNINNFSGNFTGGGLVSAPWQLVNSPNSTTSWDLNVTPTTINPTVANSQNGTNLAGAIASQVGATTATAPKTKLSLSSPSAKSVSSSSSSSTAPVASISSHLP